MNNDSHNDVIENSVVEGLLEKYEPEAKTYLGSSLKLINASAEKLSRSTMDEIFKSKSKYYPQFKIINPPTAIQHAVVYITPQIARDMLHFSRRGAINDGLNNRRESPSSVKKYKEEMNESRWCLTGQPIIIGADGEIQA